MTKFGSFLFVEVILFCWNRIVEGDSEGLRLSWSVGTADGDTDGVSEGKDVGIVDGTEDGTEDGIFECSNDGFNEGICE